MFHFYTIRTNVLDIILFFIYQSFCSVLVLVPILRSDPNPEEALQSLKNELKTGHSKMNCLQLTEKYSELTGDSKQAKAAKDAYVFLPNNEHLIAKQVF